MRPLVALVALLLSLLATLPCAEAVGFRNKAAGAPMPADAIFRIASMTKPMAAVAAITLDEDGRLLVGDPVSK